MATRARFRIATAADSPTVVDLLGQLVDELGPPDMAQQVRERLPADVAAALRASAVRVFLAEHGSAVIGLCRGDILTNDPIFRLRDDPRCGYVDQMFVVPTHRGAGIGAEMLRLCEEWFRAQGVTHVLLHAAPKAVAFYGHRGYQSNREMFKRL